MYAHGVAGRASSGLGSTLGFRDCRRSRPVRVCALGRILQVVGRGGRVWPVGALELVAKRGVGESRTERLRAAVDQRQARLRDVRAQVHVHARRDERDGHPAERVANHDCIVRAVEGFDDHPLHTRRCRRRRPRMAAPARRHGGRALRARGSERPTPRRRARRRAPARTSRRSPAHGSDLRRGLFGVQVRIRRVCEMRHPCAKPQLDSSRRSQCAAAAE